jgi:hypothetical protein
MYLPIWFCLVGLWRVTGCVESNRGWGTLCGPDGGADKAEGVGVIGRAKTEWCRFGGGSGWAGGTGDILRFSLPDRQGTSPAVRCLAS